MGEGKRGKVFYQNFDFERFKLMAEGNGGLGGISEQGGPRTQTHWPARPVSSKAKTLVFPQVTVT